jgi:biopolymer transport protein ExbB
MEILWFAIIYDWPVLTPIIFCSVLCLAVMIERYWFFRKNRVNTADFIHTLQRELDNGLDHAKAAAEKQKGILGELAAEGIVIVGKHPERFEPMFDVTTSLAMRELDRNLAVLGTIATVAPYLGLFGTVVRILLTFGELSDQTGGNVANVMFGIGSALVATAAGLGVAIAAVALNNYFRTLVEKFAGDFEVLKLVLLSVIGGGSARAQRTAAAAPYARRPVDPRMAQQERP